MDWKRIVQLYWNERGEVKPGEAKPEGGEPAEGSGGKPAQAEVKIDYDRIAADNAKTIKSTLSEMAEAEAQRESEAQTGTQQDDDGTGGAMGKYIKPHVEPAVKQAQAASFAAEAAADKSDFWSDPENEWAKPHRGAIEAEFAQKVKEGQAQRRSEIAARMRGTTLFKDQVDVEIKRRAEAEKEATEAATVGAGVFRGTPGAGGQPNWDGMSDEDLEKATKGQVF